MAIASGASTISWRRPIHHSNVLETLWHKQHSRTFQGTTPGTFYDIDCTRSTKIAKNGQNINRRQNWSRRAEYISQHHQPLLSDTQFEKTPLSHCSVACLIASNLIFSSAFEIKKLQNLKKHFERSTFCKSNIQKYFIDDHRRRQGPSLRHTISPSHNLQSSISIFHLHACSEIEHFLGN